MRILALLFLLQTVTTAVPVCPAGTAVGYFRLEARRPNTSYPVPIDRVNRLQKGDTVIFYPSDPPVPMDISGARVALMLLTPATGELRLLETRKATGRQEWILPEDATAIAVAYGPRGLDEDRMRNAATKDPELIAQLAEYSEKTAQTEIVLSALTGRRQNDDRAVDAALQGLALTGGGAKLDRSASADQQTLALMRTLNPAIGSYDPLAPEAQQRWQQSATLATSVAGLFFGNTVGLAGGGAALFLNMRSLMFPRTELRSALLREAPEAALCAAKPAGAARTKFAYLWARRLPQGTPPQLRLNKALHLAIGLPAVVPLESPEADLLSAGKAFRWKLTDAKGNSIPVAVNLPAGEKALRIAQIPRAAIPGTYRLYADWDWTSVAVEGAITLHPVPELTQMRLIPESGDRLVTGAGTVRARLTGAPSYFVNSLTMLRLGDPLAKPFPLPFAPAPDGDWLEFEVNTGGLPAGPYSLTIGQQGGGKAELALAIQAPAPTLANLPIPVRKGPAQTVTLDGRGVEQIERIKSKHAHIDWNPASRQAEVTLAADAPADIDIEAEVEGRHQPIHIAAAFRALGPKPVITAVTRAEQPAGTVERLEGEIDTGQPAAFSLQVRNLPPRAAVVLTCKEPRLTPPAAETKQIGDDRLYFTIPANAPSDCNLSVSAGGSDPVSLGRTVALPVISGFTLSDEAAAEEASFKGELRGKGLESIAKTGWTPDSSRAVTGIPSPEGEIQKMGIVMPWPAPAPHAPLRIWLRGEAVSRAATAKY